MRILHLTSHLNAGGITTTVCNLSGAFAARGHRVIVASGGGQRAAWLASRGIAHWEYPLHTSAEWSPRVWWVAYQLAARLQREPVDLIHAHTRVAQVVAEGIWRARRLPYVTTWHGFYRRRWCRRLFPCPGVLTMAISEPVARHLREMFRLPAERVRLVAQAVDVGRYAQRVPADMLEQARRQWRLQPEDVIIGAVARLVPDKGVEVLLEALPHLQEGAPTLRVLIVGDGPDRARLASVAHRLGVGASVRFVESCEDTRIPLALMRVFVFLPAVKEGFGLSLLEAMAGGVPVVAVRRGGGSTWLLDETGAGVLVDAGNPRALAEAIHRVLAEPSTASRLAQRGLEIVKARYSLDRMVEQVEQVYHECLLRAPHAS